MLTKMKISESILYVISQVIFLGCREKAQEKGEILPEVLQKLKAKFCENFVSSKFHQNRNNNHSI